MLPVLAGWLQAQSPQKPRFTALEPIVNSRMRVERQLRAEGSITLVENVLAAGVSRVFTERLRMDVRNVIGFQGILDRDLPIHRVVRVGSQEQRPRRAKSLLASFIERAQKLRQALAFGFERHKKQLAASLDSVNGQSQRIAIYAGKVLGLWNSSSPAVGPVFPAMVLAARLRTIAAVLVGQQAMSMRTDVRKGHALAGKVANLHALAKDVDGQEIAVAREFIGSSYQVPSSAEDRLPFAVVLFDREIIRRRQQVWQTGCVYEHRRECRSMGSGAVLLRFR